VQLRSGDRRNLLTGVERGVRVHSRSHLLSHVVVLGMGAGVGVADKRVGVFAAVAAVVVAAGVGTRGRWGVSNV